MLSIVVHVTEPCIQQNASRIPADNCRRHRGIAISTGSHVAKSEARVATQVSAESLPMIQHCELKFESNLETHVFSIYMYFTKSVSHMGSLIR